MTTEELLEKTNKAINDLFGLSKQRHTRGPDPDLRLYYVDYEAGPSGTREGKVFKHKKNAKAYLETIKDKQKINFRRIPHDCQFIAKEGIEQMYEEYDIEDWSFEEFKDYVEYHSKF